MLIETPFVKDGRVTFRKTPSARLLYGWDLVDWLAETGTTLLSVTGAGVGIAPAGQAFIQGTVMCVWITGLDLTDGAENSYTFDFQCADGGAESRTIHFIRRPS